MSRRLHIGITDLYTPLVTLLLVGATPVWLPAQTATRSTVPATGTGAAGAVDDSAAVAATILGLEQAMDDALARKDSAIVAQYQAPDAIIIYPDGYVSTGARSLQGLRASTYVVESARDDSVQVRVFGSTAIVTTRRNAHGHVGKDDITGAYRIQNVWMNRGARWQVISSHATAIPTRR